MDWKYVGNMRGSTGGLKKMSNFEATKVCRESSRAVEVCLSSRAANVAL